MTPEQIADLLQSIKLSAEASTRAAQATEQVAHRVEDLSERLERLEERQRTREQLISTEFHQRETQNAQQSQLLDSSGQRITAKPKQLSEEIKGKSWIVADTKAEQVLDNNTNRLWGNVLKTMGREYAMMANFPENPSLN